jgi:hypothetical protein
MDLGEDHIGRRAGPRKTGQVDPSGKPCRACTDFKSWVKAVPITTHTKPR